MEFRIAYGPMDLPSFEEWRRGRERLDELAVQRALRGESPYEKPLGAGRRRGREAAGLGPSSWRWCWRARWR